MNRRSTLARMSAAALSLAAALTATGCAGGSGGPAAPASPTPTPAGFQRAETDDYAFAVPDGWSVKMRPARSDPKQMVTEAVASAQAGPDVALALVGTTPDYRSGLDGLVLVNESSTLVNFPSSRQLSKKDVAVAGATGAKLIEAEAVVPALAKGATPTTLRLFDVVALSQDGTAVNLFVRVEVSDVDDLRAREIVASLELK